MFISFLLLPFFFYFNFQVDRTTAGVPTTFSFDVMDGCGAWSSLVGGGTSAGF